MCTTSGSPSAVMVARHGRHLREALEETGDTGTTLGRWMRERLVRPAGVTLGRRTQRPLRRETPGRRLAAAPHHESRRPRRPPAARGGRSLATAKMADLAGSGGGGAGVRCQGGGDEVFDWHQKKRGRKQMSPSVDQNVAAH